MVESRVTELTECHPQDEVVSKGLASRDGLELESGLRMCYKFYGDQTYCSDANLAIRLAICIYQDVGIRVKRVHRIRLASNLESDINLSVARYNPYQAKTRHGLQRCTGDARIYRVRHFPF